MKRYLFTILVTQMVLFTSAYCQKQLFFADIKLAKDTLYPFDMLEFTVYFQAIRHINARAYDKNSKLQIRMEEPRCSEWFFYGGLEGNFGGFTSDDVSVEKIRISPNYLFSHDFTMEASPHLSLARNDTICPYSLMTGKYTLRVIYSPNKLIWHTNDYFSAVEKCKDCVIKEVSVVVLDHYPEPDQAAYEWLKKDKASCAIFRANYASHYLEGFINLGEEFLKLFPGSSFTPAVHCKIGESMLKIYEKNAEETKLPPVEAGQKLEAIVKHLGYCRQMDAYYQLGNYYGDMYREYKDRLLRFKIRHGLK